MMINNLLFGLLSTSCNNKKIENKKFPLEQRKIFLDLITFRKSQGQYPESDSIYSASLKYIVTDTNFAYPCGERQAILKIKGYDVIFERIKKSIENRLYKNSTTFEISIYKNAKNISFKLFMTEIQELSKIKRFTFEKCEESIKVDGVSNKTPIILNQNDSGF